MFSWSEYTNERNRNKGDGIQKNDTKQKEKVVWLENCRLQHAQTDDVVWLSLVVTVEEAADRDQSGSGVIY